VRYTLLRVTADGVVLRDLHAQRLAPEGGPALAAFARFAADAAPGVYAVRCSGDDIAAEARAGSRLFDGIPVRVARSPFADRAGPFPKPAPPCAYDAVRADGVATLLTSADGAAILETCSSAVLGWDGERFLCVPGDRPRVWSTAEQAVRAHLPFGEAALPAAGAAPLLLVNAVKGPCTVTAPGRAPFPEAAVRDIERLFVRLTGRFG